MKIGRKYLPRERSLIGKHVLAVDDSQVIQDAIRLYLEREGFKVSVAGEAETAREVMTRDPADIAIIDLVLPGEDGFSLIRHFREHYDCGLIVLSSSTDVLDRILGLEIGADDFMLKPYESRELLARVRSVLRRRDSRSEEAPPEPGETEPVADFGGWRLNVSSRALTSPRGENVELTNGEFNLLKEFVDKPGRVLSREHLLQAVHNRSWDYFDRSIDVLVTRLRRKLEPEGDSIIKTVRGSGYMLAAPTKKRGGAPG